MSTFGGGGPGSVSCQAGFTRRGQARGRGACRRARRLMGRYQKRGLAGPRVFTGPRRG